MGDLRGARVRVSPSAPGGAVAAAAAVAAVGVGVGVVARESVPMERRFNPRRQARQQLPLQIRQPIRLQKSVEAIATLSLDTSPIDVLDARGGHGRGGHARGCFWRKKIYHLKKR